MYHKLMKILSMHYLSQAYWNYIIMWISRYFEYWE